MLNALFFPWHLVVLLLRCDPCLGAIYRDWRRKSKKSLGVIGETESASLNIEQKNALQANCKVAPRRASDFTSDACTGRRCCRHECFHFLCVLFVSRGQAQGLPLRVRRQRGLTGASAGPNAEVGDELVSGHRARVGVRQRTGVVTTS